MTKTTKIIIAAVVAVLLVGGGVFAYTQNKDDSSTDKMAMEKDASTDDAMAKDDTTADDAMAKDDAMMSDDAMAKHGSYVTLATYNADPSKYADSTKVYFFHAPWCPSCKAMDDAINADASKIPTGVTLIKTDFDSQTSLRQKYGVTLQHTFVQVDNDGNKVAKWSAESVDALVAGIQS
ncbi:thioredoxin family protein [Candidatus Saccharibacteria bacterium]|nr:thioredoxin family protein [Candidatus Saccharibacteria bacterium]